MPSFRRSLLLALCLALNVPTVSAQNLLSIFQLVCPILKALNLELRFCRDNVPPPSAPVPSPVKAPVPVRAPVPAPVPVKVPAPVPVKVPVVAPVAPPVPVKVPVVAPVAPPVVTPTVTPPVPAVVPAPVPVVVPAPAPAPVPVVVPVPAPTTATDPKTPAVAPLVAPVPVATLPPPLFTLLDFPGNFNAVGAGPICLTMVNRRYSILFGDITVQLNAETPVVITSLFLSTVNNVVSTRVCANKTLVNGLNTIKLVAKDNATNPLSYTTSVWAGSASLIVNVIVNGTVNTKYTEAESNVTATISESVDVPVRLTKQTIGGAVVFANLPPKTIVFTASSSRLVNSATNATSVVTRTGGPVLALAGAQAEANVPI